MKKAATCCSQVAALLRTWANWDEELLALELLDLKMADFDISLTGFDSNEIDDFLVNETPDEDAAPPLSRGSSEK